MSKLGSKAMHWSFQSVNLWNNMMGKNARIKMQNSKNEFEKNEHVCSVEDVSEFRIPLHVRT